MWLVSIRQSAKKLYEDEGHKYKNYLNQEFDVNNPCLLYTSLARDLAYLTQNSPYKAQKIQPVDMFPHTAHIETVVLMSRK